MAMDPHIPIPHPNSRPRKRPKPQYPASQIPNSKPTPYQPPQIINIILRSPRQFNPLFEADLFTDLYPVAPGNDADPSGPRSRICRMCAAEVLVWGLKVWWVQERRKGFLEASVLERPDCPEGVECERQKDQGEFLLLGPFLFSVRF